MLDVTREWAFEVLKGQLVEKSIDSIDVLIANAGVAGESVQSSRGDSIKICTCVAWCRHSVLIHANTIPMPLLCQHCA